MALRNLPQEILSEIVTYLPTTSRLALTLTGKPFKDACVRALYRHIYLIGWRKIVLCCRTLVANEGAARSVRSVSFDVSHSRPVVPLRAFEIIYHAALSRISQTLAALEILSPTPVLSPCRHTFPNLQSFTTTLVLCPLLTSFLSRHPSLTDLLLFNNFQTPPPNTPHLPNLKSFVGLADVALLLLPQAPIQHAGIAWAHSGQRTKCEEMVRVLKGVVSLIWFSTRWDGNLVECLATYLGGLECLCFAGLIPITGGRDEDFYASLTSHMHSFPRLQLIDVRSRVPVGMDIHVLEEEFRLITIWAGRCNALEVCTMPSRTYWYRLKQSGMWVPVICPDSSLATVWLCKKARAKGVLRVLDTSPTFTTGAGSSSSASAAQLSSSASSESERPQEVEQAKQFELDAAKEQSHLEEQASESHRAKVELETHEELIKYIDYIGSLGSGVLDAGDVSRYLRGSGRRSGGRPRHGVGSGRGASGRRGLFELV